MSSLAPVMEAFFTERLGRQRQASPNTVRSYRDALRLLVVFAERRTGKAPSALELSDLDAGLVSAFLDHLEAERHNSVRTRNNRMAAVRSLFRFASYREPADAAVIQRVLALPDKRARRRIVSWLSPAEVEALLDAPDRSTWVGAGTMPCWSPACRPGFGSPSSPPFGAVTWCSASAPISAATARGARSASPRSPATPWRCFARGWPSAAAGTTRPCSPPVGAGRCARLGGRPGGPPRSRRPAGLPAVVDGTGDAPHPSPHRRHEPARRRRRRGGDRPVARPRERPDDPDLPPRRSRHEAAGPRPHPATYDAGGALPAAPTPCSPSSTASDLINRDADRPRPSTPQGQDHPVPK